MRCRPTLQRPPDACLDPATCGTMKSRKPHRDLAEKRSNRALPVVLHMANTPTPSAIRPPNGVASGLRGDDLLLEAGEHSLRLGEGQAQMGDIGKIIGSVYLHDVGAPLLTISPDLHQPYNPSHSTILSHRTDPVITPRWCSNPLIHSVHKRRSGLPPTSEAVP
jgi:hypothetical protein